MKRIFFAAILIALISGVAAAQDFPRVEVFGGYSLLKMDVPDNLGELIGNPSATVKSQFLTQGFNVSSAVNLTESLGIVTDFRFNQGELLKVLGDVPSTIKVKDISVMAGPRFSFRKSEKITPFAHALAGLDYWRLNGRFDIEGEIFNETANDYGLGVAVGGGVDVNVHDNVAIRLIQADYYLTRHGENRMNNVNLAFGVVLRIGVK